MIDLDPGVAATPQPDPIRGGRSITILVVADLMANSLEKCPPRDAVIRDLVRRDEMGFKKYGQNLETFDGRNTLADAYQESLDLAQYIRKYIEEGHDDDGHRMLYLSVLSTTLAIRALIDDTDDVSAYLVNMPSRWHEVETGDGSTDE